MEMERRDSVVRNSLMEQPVMGGFCERGKVISNFTKGSPVGI